MKKHSILTSAFTLLAALAVVGCGHTNNLARYDIAGKTAMVRSFTSTRGSGEAHVANPDKDNPITGIATIIGSGIIGDQAQRKLQSAIDADSIAAAVAEGTWESASMYLGLHRVQGVDDNPDFIIETELREFKLRSSEAGLSADVCARSRVIDRHTGGLVWEDSENRTIRLSQTGPAVLLPDAVRTGVGAFNAAKLLDMSESEIRDVIQQAAELAGREIGETLRKDVADLRD